MLDARTLSGRLEIDDLLTACTVAIDTGDWGALDQVFTADAHIDHTATGGIEGAFLEVKAWLAETLPMFSAMQHFVTRKHVELAGDTARVRAYLLNPLGHRPARRVPLADGHRRVYVHDLVRTAEGWRSLRLREELVWERKPG